MMPEDKDFRLGVVGLGETGRRMLAFCASRGLPAVGFDDDAFRVKGAQVAGFAASADVAALCPCSHVWFSPDIDDGALSACVGRLAPVVGGGVALWFAASPHPGFLDEVCLPWLEKGTGRVRGRDFEVALSAPASPDALPAWVAVAGEAPCLAALFRRLYGAACPVLQGLRRGEVLHWLHNAYGVLQAAWSDEMHAFLEAHDLALPALEPYLSPEVRRFFATPRAVPRRLRLPSDVPLMAEAEAVRLSCGRRRAGRLVVALSERGIPISRAGILFYGFHPAMLPLYDSLESYTYNITVYDPEADARLLAHEYGVAVHTSLPAARYDAIVACRPLPPEEKALRRSRALLFSL